LGCSLTIVIGNVVNFVVAQNAESHTIEIIIGISSLIVCLLQFGTGRKIGGGSTVSLPGDRDWDKKHHPGHLAHPDLPEPVGIARSGTLCIVAELVNSYQIWRKTRKSEKKS
jgi:BASS family bile acid:Na+ symporter